MPDREPPEGWERRLQRSDEWDMLVGRTVALYREDRHIRTSEVEDVASDSSMMWLRFDGPHNGQLITKFDGYDIYLVD